MESVINLIWPTQANPDFSSYKAKEWDIIVKHIIRDLQEALKTDFRFDLPEDPQAEIGKGFSVDLHGHSIAELLIRLSWKGFITITVPSLQSELHIKARLFLFADDECVVTRTGKAYFLMNYAKHESSNGNWISLGGRKDEFDEYTYFYGDGEEEG